MRFPKEGLTFHFPPRTKDKRKLCEHLCRGWISLDETCPARARENRWSGPAFICETYSLIVPLASAQLGTVWPRRVRMRSGQRDGKTSGGSALPSRVSSKGLLPADTFPNRSHALSFCCCFSKWSVGGGGADITVCWRRSVCLTARCTQSLCRWEFRRSSAFTGAGDNPTSHLRCCQGAWLIPGESGRAEAPVARNVEEQPKISIKVPYHQRNGLCQGQIGPEVRNASKIDFEMVSGNVKFKTTRPGRQGCFYESIQRIKTMRINQNEKEEKNHFLACCR